jgi:copper chaperone NosL
MRAWVATLLLTVSVAACDDTTRPLEPVWNKQACAHCHMLLSEPRYAAQLVTDNGERLFFDDVGCLAAYLLRAHSERAWVRDGARWVLAQDARFNAGATTPMGYGFAADSESGSLDFAAVSRAVRVADATGAAR